MCAEQFHCKITKPLYKKPLFAAYLTLCRLPFLPSGLCRRQTAKPSDTGNGIAAGKLRCILQTRKHLLRVEDERFDCMRFFFDADSTFFKTVKAFFWDLGALMCYFFPSFLCSNVENYSRDCITSTSRKSVYCQQRTQL